jgi:hypothetical protein
LFGRRRDPVAAEPEHNEDRTEARPDALPIDGKIVGDHFQETLLLGIAATYEKQTKFNTKRPSVFFTS